MEARAGVRNKNWIKPAIGMEGCERIEAFFIAYAYEPHRHDTFAIGRTLSGIQRFNYHGEVVEGVPGTVIVLHPDEPHDGQAGTDEGFRYRMIYLEPSLIQRALGGKPLPFIRTGISHDTSLRQAVDPLLSGMGHALETLEYDDALYDLAIALAKAAGQTKIRKGLVDYRSVEQARALLDASLDVGISLECLETMLGRDRWSLSRDFRLAFGTSPYRYLIMRRLDKVKASILSGYSLAQASFEAGFADQAHMTRHFRRSFGITPAGWRELVGKKVRTIVQD